MAKVYRVSLCIDEHIGGHTYVEKRFALDLRTERDLGTLQEILINAANEANYTPDDEAIGFDDPCGGMPYDYDNWDIS